MNRSNRTTFDGFMPNMKLLLETKLCTVTLIKATVKLVLVKRPPLFKDHLVMPQL